MDGLSSTDIPLGQVTTQISETNKNYLRSNLQVEVNDLDDKINDAIVTAEDLRITSISFLAAAALCLLIAVCTFAFPLVSLTLSIASIIYAVTSIATTIAYACVDSHISKLTNEKIKLSNKITQINYS